jgi:hypothetical protein
MLTGSIAVSFSGSENLLRGVRMPKVSLDSATQGGDFGPVADKSDSIDGYTVNFVTFREDIDATPLMKGLPDDECPCPHWGYVIRGRLTYRRGDRDEVFEAGDAFYLPPGHVPVGNEPGTEIVQFSPSEQLAEVVAVMARNMQGAQVE